jgi:hypothetical protein
MEVEDFTDQCLSYISTLLNKNTRISMDPKLILKTPPPLDPAVCVALSVGDSALPKNSISSLT